MTVGKDVQESRFSGVGVSNQRHYRQPVSRSTGAALILVTAELIQLALEMSDAVSYAPPIRFQLCFAGAA